jgi:Fe-Mn family superoxide dismutase
MAPIGAANTLPHGLLAAKIEESFGSFDSFKEQFSAAAVTRFASGWAFLTVKADGSLVVHNTPGHDNPLMETVSDVQGIPILTCDVWEHAYYLRYQNRRAEFVDNWWKIVNWDAVVSNYTEFALRGSPVPF